MPSVWPHDGEAHCHSQRDGNADMPALEAIFHTKSLTVIVIALSERVQDPEKATIFMTWKADQRPRTPFARPTSSRDNGAVELSGPLTRVCRGAADSHPSPVHQAGGTGPFRRFH